MGLFNKSMQNAIQFILCVQDSCDKHRKSIEYVWLQEHTAFETEWKQNQTLLKKQVERNSDKDVTESKPVQKSSGEDLKELQEIALADSLLKKARNIRMKHQKIVNGLMEYRNISASSANSDVLMKKSMNSNQTIEKNKIYKRVPQSRSDLAIKLNNHKSTIVPRSKSATVPLMRKDDAKSSYRTKNIASLSKFDVTNHIKSPAKTSDALGVISSKEIDMFKRLQVTVPACQEVKSRRVTFSDSSEDNGQHQNLISSHSSSREFLNVMKGRLNAVSSHVKLKLWYPFLSSKTEVFLTAVGCSTFCSLKNTCSILYSIQETMMWIDLLHLMEREIYPTLVLDAKDVNMLRICSFLLSIFHPNLQRIPILDPNG